MMKNFISIFAFQSQEVCNDMYESLRFKDEMFDDKIDATDRVVSTEVWIDIAKDPRIKAKLQEEKLPIKIYKYMREEDP